MIGYLEKLRRGCPPFFDEIPNRCSQVRVRVSRVRELKYNTACQLAELALSACKNNRERHGAVEDFMLIDDSFTVAVEVSVWLYEKSLGMRMNGQVDVLQLRGDNVSVFDIKPDTDKEKTEPVKSQVYRYACRGCPSGPAFP